MTIENKPEVIATILIAIHNGYCLVNIDELISDIEETRSKDVFCDYPYVRCIEKIKELRADGSKM